MENIAFVSKAGGGKTYLCNYLKQNYGYVQAKMATGVYAIGNVYFGMDSNKKDRQLLQHIGTEVGRKVINNDIWVSRFVEDTFIAKQTYKDLYNKDIAFCSDDVRFRNEFQYLKSNGWIVIYLDVPDQIRLSRLKQRDGDAQEATLNHVSEMEIDTFKDECFKFDASGSLETTYQRLEELLEHIRRVKNENGN